MLHPLSVRDVCQAHVSSHILSMKIAGGPGNSLHSYKKKYKICLETPLCEQTNELHKNLEVFIFLSISVRYNNYLHLIWVPISASLKLYYIGTNENSTTFAYLFKLEKFLFLQCNPLIKLCLVGFLRVFTFFVVRGWHNNKALFNCHHLVWF